MEPKATELSGVHPGCQPRLKEDSAHDQPDHRDEVTGPNVTELSGTQPACEPVSKGNSAREQPDRCEHVAGPKPTEPRGIRVERQPNGRAAHVPRSGGSFGIVVRDGAILVAVTLILGLASNALRPNDKIAWIQQEEYEILVPCPEPTGEVTAMAPDDPALKDSASLVIDARSPKEFGSWHVPKALDIEFDWLGPPIDEEVKRVAKQVAASQSHRVIVYGDGDDPDSGREWARLLSGGGIKNVFYVTGGGPALKQRLKEVSVP
ncbi:rhodanese-like domain-containing protein [Myxococcota bacterium]